MDRIGLERELQACCSAVGSWKDGEYMKDKYCVESMKDMIHILKKEDEFRSARRWLLRAHFVHKDLIPLIVKHFRDRDIYDICLKLIVNLTTPSIVCFGKVPSDKDLLCLFLELDGSLRQCKPGFVNEDLFHILVDRMREILEIDSVDRLNEINVEFERLLLLARNLLYVTDDDALLRTDDDVSVHDQLVWVFHRVGFLEILKYLSSSESDRRWAIHVLEILALLLSQYSPESLLGRSTDNSKFQQIRLVEAEKARRGVATRAARHPRFGGTFCVTNVKSIADTEAIYHGKLEKAEFLSFEEGKRSRAVPLHKRPVSEAVAPRESTVAVRGVVRGFVEQFVADRYNQLMESAKEHLDRTSSEHHDESFYLIVLQFFLSFVRLSDLSPTTVSSTLNLAVFHYVEVHLQTYYENLLAVKVEKPQWVRRLHLGIRAFSELLRALHWMGRSDDKDVRDSSRILQNNVFYIAEYREQMVFMLKKYDDTKMGIHFLRDVVEMGHVFTRMLESYSRGKSAVFVQSKKNKRVKKSKKAKSVHHQSSRKHLEDIWSSRLQDEVSAAVKGETEVIDDVVPFDVTSERPIEEQEPLVLARIRDNLRDGNVGTAVGLMRASRNVWNERSAFYNTVSTEAEIEKLKELFLDDELEAEVVEEIEQKLDEEGWEEDDDKVVRFERQFDFPEYVRQFCHPKVVSAAGKLLSCYATNTAFTNHCVVKLLHRIAIDMKFYPMVFQLRLFVTFNDIMNDPVCATPQFDESKKFIRHILGLFIGMLAVNKCLSVEFLFWKSSRETDELIHGYGSSSMKVLRKYQWTDELEATLKELFEKHKEDREEGPINRVVEEFPDENFSRKRIVSKLRELELLNEEVMNFPRRKKLIKHSISWEDDEVELLKGLFAQHGESNTPLFNIMKELPERITKKDVTAKLLELELISDKKELQRKKTKSTVTWTTDEVDKLRELFETHCSGDTLIPNIMKELPSKFTKKTILGKLIELELIESLDSYRGKYKADSKKVKKQSRNQVEAAESREHNDDESHATSSEDDVTDDGLPEVNLGELLALAREQHVAAVDWLADLLWDTAEDRDSSGSEMAAPRAVIPLSEHAESAMEDPDFRRMLTRLGVAEPERGEMFWRVPVGLASRELRNAAAALRGSEEGLALCEELTNRRVKRKRKSVEVSGSVVVESLNESTVEQSESDSESGMNHAESDSASDALESLFRSSAGPKSSINNRSRRSAHFESDDADEVIETDDRIPNRSTDLDVDDAVVGIGRPSLSNMSDSDDDELSKRVAKRKANSPQLKKKRRRVVIDDDDSGDNEVVSEDVETEGSSPEDVGNKRRVVKLLESSDSEPDGAKEVDEVVTDKPDVITDGAGSPHGSTTSGAEKADESDDAVSMETSNEPVSTELANEPVSTELANEPVSTELANEPVSTELANGPVSTELANEPVSTELANEPVSTELANGPVSTELANEPVSTELANEPVSKET